MVVIMYELCNFYHGLGLGLTVTHLCISQTMCTACHPHVHCTVQPQFTLVSTYIAVLINYISLARLIAYMEDILRAYSENATKGLRISKLP